MEALRGRVESCGLAFDVELLGSTLARRRALRALDGGALLFEAGPFLFVLWSKARRVEVSGSPGAAIVERSGTYYVAPIRLKPSECHRPPKSLVFARFGELREVASPRWRAADPGAWIDLSSFEPLDVPPLGSPPRPAALEVEPAKSAQELLMPGGGQEAPAEVAAAIQGLKTVPGSGGASILELLRAAFARLFRAWRPHKPDPRRVQAPMSVAIESKHPSEPTLGDAIRSFLARIRLIGALRRLAGERHARYIEDMLDMFERGDLDQALRHAVPIAPPSSDPGRPSQLSLSPLRPRVDLRITPQSRSAELSISDRLAEELRKTYRRASERLIRAGRIPEAAFVLAELIGESIEAVELLESSGLRTFAAELAEARGLHPAVVVRQWIVAGNVARALAFARAHRAFEPALALLERSPEDRERWRTLRVAYADHLAATGDLERAVETIWPIEDARALAERWIELGIERGGPECARLLVRKLSLGTGDPRAIQRRVSELLAEDGADSARVRLTLARRLRDELRSRRDQASGVAPHLRATLSSTVRALISDKALGWVKMTRADFADCARAAGDDALAADLPVIPESPSRLSAASHGSRRPTLQRASEFSTMNPSLAPPISVDRIAYARSSSGTFGAMDAAVLPNGQTLVALGEAGVRLLSRAGKTVAVFDVPADRLVISARGESAIAMAGRGRTTLLSRIDLLWRRARRWGALELSATSRAYWDGRWFAATPSEVIALDVLADVPKVMWRVDKLGGRPRAVRAAELSLSFVVQRDDGRDDLELECWRYDLPSPVLRSRREIDAFRGSRPEGRARATLGLTPDGGLATVTQLFEQGRFLAFIERPSPPGSSQADVLGVLLHGDAPGDALIDRVEASTSRVAILVQGPECATALAYIRDTGDAFAAIRLEGAKRANLRLEDQTLVLCDDRGRLVVYDTERGELARDLRLD